MKPFELVEHTADVALNIYGANRQELFANAVTGMAAIMAPGYQRQDAIPSQEHIVVVQAHDQEMLLADFLSQVLYLSDVHDQLFTHATIQSVDTTKLHATLYGVPFGSSERVDIKAVTYHNLRITEQDGVWQAHVVFDI